MCMCSQPIVLAGQANKGKNGRHEISLLAKRPAHIASFQIDIDFIDRFWLRSMSDVASYAAQTKTAHLNMIFFPTLCENPSYPIKSQLANQPARAVSRHKRKGTLSFLLVFFFVFGYSFSPFYAFSLLKPNTLTHFSHNQTYLTIVAI